MNETDYKSAIAALRRAVSGLKRERTSLEETRDIQNRALNELSSQLCQSKTASAEWERRARELGWTESGRPPETL